MSFLETMIILFISKTIDFVIYLWKNKRKQKSNLSFFKSTNFEKKTAALFLRVALLISHAKFYLFLVFSLIINPITKPADKVAKLQNMYSIKSPHLLKNFINYTIKSQVSKMKLRPIWFFLRLNYKNFREKFRMRNYDFYK